MFSSRPVRRQLKIESVSCVLKTFRLARSYFFNFQIDHDRLGDIDLRLKSQGHRKCETKSVIYFVVKSHPM